MHARLTKLDENWKNNEIAEKIKQQKEADMALLQTRWKNGVLNEDDNDRDTVVRSYVNGSVIVLFLFENTGLMLRVHVASTSPFFVLFKSGFNAVLWRCVQVTSTRSKVPLTKTVTLAVCVNER